MKQYYVYILTCSDGSYYTGITNNLQIRVSQHQQGLNKNCYTYLKRPVELVFHSTFNDVLQAIAFEKKIKGWSRKKKQALISGEWNQLKQLSSCKNGSHSSLVNEDK